MAFLTSTSSTTTVFRLWVFRLDLGACVVCMCLSTYLSCLRCNLEEFLVGFNWFFLCCRRQRQLRDKVGGLLMEEQELGLSFQLLSSRSLLVSTPLEEQWLKHLIWGKLQTKECTATPGWSEILPAVFLGELCVGVGKVCKSWQKKGNPG
jgi:hypothetical protein